MSTNANWSLDAVKQLRGLAREGLPLPVISLKLKRPVDDIAAKLAELGITPAASA